MLYIPFPSYLFFIDLCYSRTEVKIDLLKMKNVNGRKVAKFPLINI